MSKNIITVELTEEEALLVKWAAGRALAVTSAASRGVLSMRALQSATLKLQRATEGLPDLPPQKVRTKG
jgi:hypothetical protein